MTWSAALVRASGRTLAVALVGQPELARRLDEPLLRQLKQRVALRCTLAALSLSLSAFAQDFPTKPIKIVVPDKFKNPRIEGTFAAEGGSGDRRAGGARSHSRRGEARQRAGAVQACNRRT